MVSCSQFDETGRFFKVIMAISKFTHTSLYAALLVGLASYAQAESAKPPTLALGDKNPHCVAPNATMVTPAKTSGEAALPQDYTRLTADLAAGQTNNRAKAEGDVILERNGQVINAQWVDVDLVNNVARAGNEFTLSDAVNNSHISGEQLVFNLDTKQGEASGARFETQQDGRRLQGVSGSMQMLGDNRYRLEQTKVNTCDPGDESWYIKADSVTADYNQNVGVAKNAALIFKGVPLLYSPWMDFPLHGERKSGLLLPMVKTGSNGFELSTPYYMNLGSNYDATVTPHWMSDRGMAIGGEFRYLQPEYYGRVAGEWLPDDRKNDEKNRYEISWQHEQQFTPKLNGGVNFNQVSDDDYREDFGGRSDVMDGRHLRREAWLDFNDQWLGGDFDSRLQVQKFQTLQNDARTIDEPYQLMPRLSATWSRDFDQNVTTSVFGQFTNFEHDKKASGQRAVLYPQVAWDVTRPWGYFRPKFGMHMTQYALEKDSQQIDSSKSRTLPILSVDTGLIFDRPYQFQNVDYVQTLEPRLFYTYIPGKDQSHFPNFDTSEDSQTYDSLFRENRFSGQDRINAANQVTTALMTKFLEMNTGKERFKAAVGQRIYFKDDDVDLSGRQYQREQGKSDVFVFGGGQVHEKIYAESEWHYSQEVAETESFSVGARYEHAPGRNVSARYRYERNDEIYSNHYGENKQIDIGAQWALNNNYSVVARQYYSLSESKPLDQIVGVEYKSDCGCWNASMVAQRYVSDLDKSKNAIFFQLQLRNLSNLGNNPTQVLHDSIPSYQPLTDEKANK
ncbi:LPS-assembly protein LptD [Vitreoscilla sp. C1]|uniref:LPS-assembly protein LptD n=1 Tax=Vitreoscilla sp. (strain C1) TaxID=96942 RepID=UPI000CDC6452|nr:LPS-assembly protein LptD [Vitreoscilla sp. C1]AUZ06135.1 LPS-assembly protein LptD [Vitreoscilla sp. C1]